MWRLEGDEADWTILDDFGDQAFLPLDALTTAGFPLDATSEVTETALVRLEHLCSAVFLHSASNTRFLSELVVFLHRSWYTFH